jgi:hypothetical protein
MWKNYFSQLFNVHIVRDVRQIKVHTPELLVPDTCPEVKIATAKFNKYQSKGSDQIPAELIQAEGETLLAVINKLVNSIWNMKESLDQWKEFIIVLFHKEGDKTDL